MISHAIGDIIGNSLIRCVFIDTSTPRIIRKIKQGIQFYTKHKKYEIAGRRRVLYNRMIVSLRLDNHDSCLA
jgi:hypothetical protein